jgi:hypothetical protein
MASEVKSLIESRQQHLKGLFQDHEFYWNLIKHFDAIRTIHFESKAQVCESKGQFSDLSDTLLIGVLQFLKNDWPWLRSQRCRHVLSKLLENQPLKKRRPKNLE